MMWIAAAVVLLVHVEEVRDDEDHVVLWVDNHFGR